MQTRSMSKNNTSLPPPVRVKPVPPPPRELDCPYEQMLRRKRIAYNRKKWEQAMARAQEHCMKYHGGPEINCICAEEEECHCDGCECNCWEGSEPDESFDFKPDYSDDEDWY